MEATAQAAPSLRRPSQSSDHPDGAECSAECSADEGTVMVSREGEGSRVNYQTAETPAAEAPAGNNNTPAVAAPTLGPDIRAGPRARRSDPSNRMTWLSGFLAQFHSIELENKGSVARDHLAIERTFLAWLRTSLAFASIGIAVTQLFRLNAPSTGKNALMPPGSGEETLGHLGKPLGATFLAISILVLLLGYRRYVESQRWVMEGKFPASRGTVVLVAAVAFALMVASLVVVVAVQPSVRER